METWNLTAKNAFKFFLSYIKIKNIIQSVLGKNVMRRLPKNSFRDSVLFSQIDTHFLFFWCQDLKNDAANSIEYVG